MDFSFRHYIACVEMTKLDLCKSISNMGVKFGACFCDCHSEGATRSDLTDEKIIFPIVSIETTATEESLFSSRHERKILRRPFIPWQLIK